MEVVLVRRSRVLEGSNFKGRGSRNAVNWNWNEDLTSEPASVADAERAGETRPTGGAGTIDSAGHEPLQEYVR
jgi:hypothetical protein